MLALASHYSAGYHCQGVVLLVGQGHMLLLYKGWVILPTGMRCCLRPYAVESEAMFSSVVLGQDCWAVLGQFRDIMRRLEQIFFVLYS